MANESLTVRHVQILELAASGRSRLVPAPGLVR